MLQLREIRKSRGLAVNQMCERLGVKENRYYKWEQGTTEIPLSFACRCADILHCTLDEMVGRKSKSALSDDEQRLVSCFRSTDARGRDTIMTVAETQAGDEGRLPAAAGRAG